MHEIGRILITLGLVLAAAGAFLLLAHKVPWLGHLPGDIVIRRKNVFIYFPLATSLIISIILSVLFWVWSRR
ncbi:MAG TPA: DUF2905 domain-containing protein [Candidatus Omnitrophota bacterium]|nr:DUF2905 domain-containing protein [Candidatus Omnitrophota bacterium]HQJ15423.1 DUF2905 domain-containing protein [Candidatus Omnitrophota bacterium]